MMAWLSVALPAVPLLGALLLLLAPNRLRPLLHTYGLTLSGLTLALAVLMAATFDYSRAARPQFEVDQAWIPGLGLRFHLGVDGISLPLIVLTALLTFLCFVYLCWGAARKGFVGARPRALVFTLLVLEVGMIGTFLALDLLLFFVFFEIVLIPMYFLIGIWGGGGRRAASVKFILYTLLGSVVMLLGLLLVWAQTGTLDIEALSAAHGAGMARSVQILAFVAIGIGLAVKTPMWPLHTWLPDAHTEAPTVGSVLLAGVLLKMGTYGFARIAIPILPEGAMAVAPWLGAFAVVGIIYGALACLAQRDLKRMIAYSSVGHMGFVLLGFATLTPVGINGALFANVAHGLITGLLFFLAGAIKDRYHTADMPSLGGGMLATLPRLGSLLTFASIASLGLPGLAGFWGEMLALFGAFQPANGLPRALFLTYMAIGGLGAVLTAAYFLVMLSRVTHGRPRALSDEREGVTPDERPVVPLGSTARRSATATLDPPPRPEPYSGRNKPPNTPEPGTPPDHTAPSGGEAYLEDAGPLNSGTPSDNARPSDDDAWPPDARAVSSGGALTGGAEPAGGPQRAIGAPPQQAPDDIRSYELLAWTPLVALILLFGLWPGLLLSLTTPAVQTLLGAVS
ncbi:complex I subunit 4 family protein [Nonomuraea jabiensis]|uniref:NADH-quinone oxidoreductase subunit M n=1 Tax=Nonomuraea jabiensis TaxID=882448 RepID=A0A7W9G3V4_9ACTN|nr:NADH-quinone oxidoreductase subunit M [Nonomuraea jabiensis]MBB5776571.1 NADH-quinone oxidoreductase subunit M [Nonomuraea jabiensis]